jgi:hypothetical protein
MANKTKSYVKEVQAVLDLGYTEADAVKIFEVVVDRFERAVGGLEPEEFHDRVLDLRKNERAFYREMIDHALSYTDYDELTWREVRFEPTRVKRCAQCGNWFYDSSRNGKKITCNRFGVYRRWDMENRKYRYYHKHGNKLSECGARYELARVPTTRRVQEVPFNPNPSGEDIEGNVFLDEIEDANQRHLNPYHNEWTYWRR